MIQATNVFYPSNLVDSKTAATIENPHNPIGHGSDATSYVQGYITLGIGAESYIIYGFDTSIIPKNANIISVSCSAKVYLSNVSSMNLPIKEIQMFSGDTAKGLPTLVSRNDTTADLDTGSWTVDEVKNARIRLYVQRSARNSTSSYYFRFYGASLTIAYEYENRRYLIKTSNGWTAQSEVYRKTSSGWQKVGADSYSELIPEGTKLKYAGSYEPPTLS